MPSIDGGRRQGIFRSHSIIRQWFAGSQHSFQWVELETEDPPGLGLAYHLLCFALLCFMLNAGRWTLDTECWILTTCPTFFCRRYCLCLQCLSTALPRQTHSLLAHAVRLEYIIIQVHEHTFFPTNCAQDDLRARITCSIGRHLK